MKKIISIILLFALLTGCTKNSFTANDYFSEAEKLASKGEYSEAFKNYEKAYLFDKTYLDAYLGASDILTLKNNLEGSKAIILQAINANPEHLLSLDLKLAEIEYNQANFSRAIEIYDSILLTEVNNIQALLGKLKSLILLDKFSDAQQIINTYALEKNTIQAQPTGIEYYLLKISLNIADPNIVEQILIEASELEDSEHSAFLKNIKNDYSSYKIPEQRLAVLSNMSNRLIQSDYLEVAYPIAFEIIRTNEYYEMGYFYKGIILLKRGLSNSAIPALETALKYRPDMLNARVYLVEAYFLAGNSDQGVAVSNSSKDFLSLDHVEELQKLFSVLNKYEQYKVTNELLNYLLNLNANNLINADLKIIQLMTYVNLDKYSEAKIIGDDLLVNTSSLTKEQKVKLFSYYGYTLFKLNEKAKGMSYIKQAENLDNKFSESYFFEGVILNDQGQFDKAKQVLKRAVDLDLTGQSKANILLNSIE